MSFLVSIMPVDCIKSTNQIPKMIYVFTAFMPGALTFKAIYATVFPDMFTAGIPGYIPANKEGFL